MLANPHYALRDRYNQVLVDNQEVVPLGACQTVFLVLYHLILGYSFFSPSLEEEFAILSNVLSSKTDIKIFFATAYNRYGETKPWRQERVRQFFATDELLIGKDFWNFVCRSNKGYKTVLEAYRESAPIIKQALDSIKKAYLG